MVPSICCYRCVISCTFFVIQKNQESGILLIILLQESFYCAVQTGVILMNFEAVSCLIQAGEKRRELLKFNEIGFWGPDVGHPWSPWEHWVHNCCAHLPFFLHQSQYLHNQALTCLCFTLTLTEHHTCFSQVNQVIK